MLKPYRKFICAVFYFDPIIILFSAYSPKNGRKPDKLYAFLLSDDLFHSYFCCRQNLEIQPLSIFSKNITDCPIKRYQIFSLQQCRTGHVAVCLPATWPGIIHFRKEHIILLSIKKTERKKEEEKSDCKRHTQTALQ